MSKFLMKKGHLGDLHAADDYAVEQIKKIKMGATVQVEVRRPRNLKHHQKYWVLLTLVYDNLPEDIAPLYPTIKNYHDTMKILTGWRTVVHLPGGGVAYAPRSIAFHKMDQALFDEFYARCLDKIAKYFLPGVSSELLRAKVEELLK